MVLLLERVEQRSVIPKIAYGLATATLYLAATFLLVEPIQWRSTCDPGVPELYQFCAALSCLLALTSKLPLKVGPLLLPLALLLGAFDTWFLFTSTYKPITQTADITLIACSLLPWLLLILTPPLRKLPF